MSRTEELVEQVAKIYTPVMVVGAVLLAAIPSIVCDSRQQSNEFVQMALVMLVIACPCALVISTPIAYVCSVARAAQFGILIKGGKHMAALAQMTNAALDKSGIGPPPLLLPPLLSRLMMVLCSNCWCGGATEGWISTTEAAAAENNDCH